MAEPNVIYSIKYGIDVSLFTEDGKNEFEPLRIDSMSWDVDYSKSFSPNIKIVLQLTPGHIRIIKDNMSNILMHLKMTRIKYINSLEDQTDRTPVESELLYDTIFVPIVESDDIINLRNFPEDNTSDPIEEQEIGGNDASINIYNVRMYINTLDYHLMYKKTYNSVLRSAKNGPITVDTALKFICETSDVKGYIIDVPDNNIPVNNIIISPGNVKYVIDCLQIMYGVYLRDILSFYDIDGKLYILSKLSKTHDYEKGKIRKTIVRVSPVNDVETMSPGTITYDTDDTVILNLIKGLEDVNVGIAAGEAHGDSIIFTNYGFSSETFTYKDGKIDEINSPAREFIRNSISHSKTSKGISFEYDELNNPFNMFSNLSTFGIDTVYIIKSHGIDIDCLKPNVIYNIEIPGNEVDNSKYIKKDYNLLGFQQNFLRDNDSGTINVFKSYEVLSLACSNKK